MRPIIFSLFLVLSSLVIAEEMLPSAYAEVELVEFYNSNHIPVEMAEKKQRVMLHPSPVSFTAELVTRPKPGEFSLAYDALQLWGGTGELPVINHSAFVGFPDNGPVLGVYVSAKAAEMLEQVAMDKPLTFYAMHIYNYAKGPRLVIVAAKPE